MRSFILSLVMFAGISTPVLAAEPMAKIISEAFERACEQSLMMAGHLADDEGALPKTFQDGRVVTSDSRAWTSGFFAGTLWLLYESTGDKRLAEYARAYTLRVEREQYTTSNHDVGFIIFCSFGNGYRLTADPHYKEVIVQAARSLSTRFNPTVGAIRSWEFNRERWQYPVIIDNMMNLELLLWSDSVVSDGVFRNIAISHADKGMENHFRSDYSSYHVVSYDTLSGRPHIKQTHQGFADDSSWARGQAWGLYGFTMMYRYTQDPKYLQLACDIASFLINHPRMPKDGIPYWDLDAPDIPNALRDASAASIMASALIELSGYVDAKAARQYIKMAEKQLRTLASLQYTAKTGENGNFILMHGVGHLPGNSEIDVPLAYGDYYYLEALARYKRHVLSSK